MSTYAPRPDLNAIESRFKNRHALFTTESPLVEGVRDIICLVDQIPELIDYIRHLEAVLVRHDRFVVVIDPNSVPGVDPHKQTGLEYQTGLD